MAFLALALALSLIFTPQTQSPAPAQDSQPVPVPKAQWKEVLKPISGEYNLGACGNGVFSSQHAKLNFDDDSYSALTLVSAMDLEHGEVKAFEHPTVFNLDEVSTVQDGDDKGLMLEFSWRADASSPVYFKMVLLAGVSKTRVVGFLNEVATVATTQSGKLMFNVPVAKSVLMGELGTVDALPAFAEDTYDVCRDMQDLGDDDVSKVMTLWVTGHYKPRTREVPRGTSTSRLETKHGISAS